MSYDYDVNDCGNMVGIEDYRKLEAQLAALKEENERLFALNAEVCGEAVKVSKERDALKARVAELEHTLKTLVEHNS